MQLESNEKKLKNWLTSFIEGWRIAHKQVDENIETYVQDFHPPCQVELFWITEPEYQLLCVTKHNDRNDKEIIINGPYEAFEFANQIESILQEPRWRKRIPNNLLFPQTDIGGKISYAEAFASILEISIETIKKSVFEQQSQPVILSDDSIREWWLSFVKYGGSFTRDDFAWLIKGNITERNPSHVAKVLLYLEQVSKRLTEEKKFNGCSLGGTVIAQHDDDFFAHMGPSILKMFGCSFYPPCWFGKKPPKSVKAQILGKDYLLRSSAFELQFNDKKLIIYSNGYLAIEAESRTAAKHILNTIMGVALKNGINCIGVDESEIDEVGVDPSSLNLISKSRPTISSVRTLTEIVKRSDIDQVPEIETARIKNIVKCAEKIAQKQDNTPDQLLLWVESQTHTAIRNSFRRL